MPVCGRSPAARDECQPLRTSSHYVTLKKGWHTAAWIVARCTMRVESAVRRHQARAVARGDTAQGCPRPVRVFSKCWLEQHTASRACARGAVVVSGAAADSEAVPEAVSEHGLPRTASVGILGGGQLGRMTALAAGNMGVKVKCLDPSNPAPASVAADCVVGSFRDEGPIKELAKDVDVLTFEIEHIDVEAVAAAAEAEARVEVQPDLWTLSVIQDKYRQKQHFSSVGVATAEFREIKCRGCAEKAAAEYGFPFMLKSKRLAYDGRGNAVVDSEEGMDAAVESLGGYDHGLYAERWAPFVKELAVMVARSRTGEVKSYPVVETVHKDSILNVCEAPADVSTQSRGAAQQLAEQAVRSLRGAGIYGVELFLLADGSLLLNEVAPRPHNSGHYTMDACATSQFEQHLRAILGWPLGDTSLLPEAAITLNLLGEADGEEGVRLAHRRMAAAYATPGASVHWYCKEGCRKQRKVGHINITGTSRAEARQRLSAIDADAAAALQRTAATEEAGPKVAIIMGSDSDLPTMRAAAQVLDDFNVACEVTVVSAHRTPERMMEYARSAHGRGIKVIVAGAGGAAHLPGMVAAMTPLPVIGVPVTPAGCHLDGLDALMSICQMPRGVPVATVAIGNAANAGLLALRILASAGERPQLLQAMLDYQQGMKDTVLGKAERLEAKGWRDY